MMKKLKMAHTSSLTAAKREQTPKVRKGSALSLVLTKIFTDHIYFSYSFIYFITELDLERGLLSQQKTIRQRLD